MFIILWRKNRFHTAQLSASSHSLYANTVAHVQYQTILNHIDYCMCMCVYIYTYVSMVYSPQFSKFLTFIFAIVLQVSHKNQSAVFVSKHSHRGILGCFCKVSIEVSAFCGPTVQADRVAIEDLGE